MGSSRRPLKLHHLAAAVVGQGEALLVGTINMTVTKIQHFVITWERERKKEKGYVMTYSPLSHL